MFHLKGGDNELCKIRKDLVELREESGGVQPCYSYLWVFQTHTSISLNKTTHAITPQTPGASFSTSQPKASINVMLGNYLREGIVV